MSSITVNMARQFLARPHHNVYRRSSGRPVKVQLTPLNKVPNSSVIEWMSYHNPLFQIRNARKDSRNGIFLSQPQTDNLIDAPHYHTGYALMEGDRLQGFIQGRIRVLEACLDLAQLISAPWNVLARASLSEAGPTVAKAFERSDWQLTAEQASLAVKGVGWTLSAALVSTFYLTADPEVAEFARVRVISPYEESFSFYEKHLGVDLTGELVGQTLRSFIRQAWRGEMLGRPGWKLTD